MAARHCLCPKLPEHRTSSQFADRANTMASRAIASIVSCSQLTAARGRREGSVRSWKERIVRRRLGRPACLALLAFAALALASLAQAQPLPTARPEEVGLSPERLARIGAVFRKDIDAGKLPGAVIM